MKHGFIKIASITPKIQVADPGYNAQEICKCIEDAVDHGAKIIVFPELCITGYTCNDLFLQDLLLEKAQEQLLRIVAFTEGKDALIFVGLPLEHENKLYNVAAVLNKGEILAFIPKTFIPNYAEFYESRYFTPGNKIPVTHSLGCKDIPFGTNILFQSDVVKGLMIGCEICEDMWVANPPSSFHTRAGATLMVNLSASNETVGKDEYRQLSIRSTSARLLCGYVYASAGEGESTQDLVFGGHNLIAENGSILAESSRFLCETIYGEVDIQRLCMERRKMNTFIPEGVEVYRRIPFQIKSEKTELTRIFEKLPFVPQDPIKKEKRCNDILSMQSYGLKKRYEHTGCQVAVIGISGGLDSTLALLVTVRAFDLLGLDRKNIIAVTMPCFGTTDRTYENACKMSRTLGATLREIDIKKSVSAHLRDIGQDPFQQDVTYENAQARERTQVLMDIANQVGGLVIGTGDMSELALGWATYNGDHMSMYGVNAGVPKTLIRHLVQYGADTCQSAELKAVLLDVLDTPVSPELLPPIDGNISQKTEDLVGPYELHDFFLYYMLRMGFSPDKVLRIAQSTFYDMYEEEVIHRWIQMFYKRFFQQQFKRSCLPDGPKVGSVALSPRGDLRMPSDASASIWMQELER